MKTHLSFFFMNILIWFCSVPVYVLLVDLLLLL